MATSLLQSATTTTPHLRTDRKRIAERIAGCACTTLLAISTLTGICHGANGNDSQQATLVADYGKVPLSFEPNRGQTDPRVQFLSRGEGYGIFLTPGEAVLSLQKPVSAAVKLDKDGKLVAAPTPQSSVFRMTLVGAKTDAPASAKDQLPGTSNYFLGHDATSWATDVPTYGKVSYGGVYPGIDLVYYGNQHQLEYDFVVAPNADARQIALSFSGATPRLDAQGNLVLSTPGGETSFHKPVVYQMEGDAKVPVEAVYNVARQAVTFSLGAYDHSKPLVIDPVLSYGTFLGGSLDDRGTAIAVDASGNAYVVGDTVSLNFPLLNAIQTTNHDVSNGWVVFVTKLNLAGSAVVYSTFLGGVADSHALGVAVDSTGSAFVAGYTSAGDFPVTAGAFQTLCGGNAANPNGVHTRINGCATNADTNGFVAKLTPAGNSLAYSTFLGGSGYTAATGIAVDGIGEAYIGGDTNASCGPGPYWITNHAYPDAWDCFPTTTSAYQATYNGQTIPGTPNHSFFTKLSADGSTLMYSTEFMAPMGTAANGGGLANSVAAVAVDAAGNGYIVGNGGYGLPTTPNAYYVPPANTSTVPPPYPAYVVKFNPAASGAASLVYSTFLGSAAQTAAASNYTNNATGVVVNANGSAIVTGYSNYPGYPTTTGAYQTAANCTGGCGIGFVTKLSPDGTAIVWSTLLGEQPNSHNSLSLNGIAQGANGNIYVIGNVNGFGDYPAVNPIASGVNGGSVISELNSTGTSLLFSSYISGYGGTDYAAGVATDQNGNMYLAGKVDGNTPTIPTTKGALQTTYQGGPYDAFVVKIAPTIASTTTLTVPASATAGQSAIFSATVAGPSGTTAVPTGTVTFLSGSTTLGTGTLNGSGVATYTAASLNATTYNVTASYPGDTNFSSSVSAAKPLVVSPATPTVTLTAPATAVVGASITLAASVTGTGGTPTGTVIFKDGTTTLSTVTLASGSASYSTSSLAQGAHSITASYSGDSIFAAATSAAQTVTISVAPALTFAALPTSLTITHGSSGTVVITGTPVGGYSGTATFACGTMPADASCTFSPASLAFSGSNTAQSTTLTISTSMTTAKLEHLSGRGMGAEIFAAMLLPLGWMWRRRRHAGKSANLVLLALLFAAFCVPFTGLTGCSSGSSAPTVVTTPIGSYSVSVTVTAPNANATINVPMTVQ